MLTPDKMSRLQNNEVINMYEKLNHEITKEIISKIKEYDELLFLNKSKFKTTLKQDKNRLFKDVLKKTRRLNMKSKKTIKNVYKELSDALNDDK